tara:strand:- start:2040 stop:2354 length:315 start_codon:yes stop_codon:yes gene_type:complete
MFIYTNNKVSLQNFLPHYEYFCTSREPQELEKTMDEKNFYIEFSLEGIIKVSGEEKNVIVNDLKKIFSKILKRDDLLRVISNINLASEEEVMLPLVQDMSDTFH